LDISSHHSAGKGSKSKKDLNRVIAVKPGSVAARAGIKPQDRLLAINNATVRDMIDYQFDTAEANLRLTIERDKTLPGGEIAQETLQLRLRNAAGEPIGLEFAEPTFDGIRVCNNDCPFCFVYRTPKGFRPTVYIKDDDYRYSFMYGGFVTLTNLKEEDWQRIISQRLTPLYVSVHSTEFDLRRRLLGNPTAPEILGQLQRLIDNGIQVHTQIVLVPGVNDGEHLERTVHDLAKLYPGVQTIAIVPVGLAGGNGYAGDRRRSGRGHGRTYQNEEPMSMRVFKPEEAAQIVDTAHNWQRHFKKTHGTALVYLSDEFYLLCGREVPGRAHYEEFDQIENGVGLVRNFLEDWKRLEKKLPAALNRPITATLVTAELITPTFQPLIDRLNRIENLDLNLVTIKNRTFGPTITVAGLLTGHDVIDTLKTYVLQGHSLGEVLFLPQIMLDKKGYGARFLDDLTPAEVEAELGLSVVMAGLLSEVWQSIQTLQKTPTKIETALI
jgi:putative radical SAM enzyme (TIGR03279 family)